MSILVVEDDASTREMMVRILRRAGYNSHCAGTLAEAKVAVESKPSCVLLDLTLPDGSGLEVLERATELGVPVALLSGKHSQDLPDAVMLKPAAVFTKPVDFTEVVSWMRLVCGSE
jgi:DNA-binding response OmpR family regulator